MGDALQRGRAAYERQAWSDAYAALAEADTATPLDASDLDRLAPPAHLIGLDEASATARGRAYEPPLHAGDRVRAAASAIGRIFLLGDQRNREAEMGGWIARAERLLDEHGEECAERGFLLCFHARRKAGEGAFDGAREFAARAVTLGERFGNPDVTSLARHIEGRTMLRQQRTAAGFACLDEVMVAIATGEVGPLVTGIVYCSALSACHDVFDLRRAQEWTTSLSGWCAAHPARVPLPG